MKKVNLFNLLNPHTPLQMVSEHSRINSTEELYMLKLELKLIELELNLDLELELYKLELKYLPTKIEN